MSKFLGIFFLLVIIDGINCARILFFFSGGTYSHEISVAPLVERLSIDHNITFLSSHKKKPFNLPNVEIIAPQVVIDYITREYGVERIGARLDKQELQIWQDLLGWSAEICDILLNSDDIELQNFFSKRQFDLILIDSVLCDCGFIAAHIFKAKSIIIDSTAVLPWYYDIFHLPKESGWLPQITTAPHYPMGFYDRMLNYFETFYWTAFRRLKMYPALEISMRKFFGHTDFPSFVELERNASLVFLNTHYGTDFARSLPPSFIQIGGLQLWEKDVPIPKDITTFIDKSKTVVLIAYGSSVDMNSMPKEVLTVFFESIRRLENIHFIWKWSGEIPENAPKNVLFVSWLPQKEILGQMKTAAFINHCGINSIMESTYHGVPIIGMPLFADQDVNCYRIESEKIGIRLELRDVDANILSKAVGEVIYNKIYKSNMKKFSRAFRDRPMPPIDTALYWINYVLRNDDLSPLKPKLDHVSFIQLYHFDMIISIFLIVLVSVLAFIFVLKCAISRSFSAVELKPKKKIIRKKKN